MRDNRKEVSTTDRLGAGHGREGEKSKDNGEILSLGGREDGNAINKNRLPRRGQVERESEESVLHTLRCGDAPFSTWSMSPLFIRKMHEDGEWAPQATRRHESIFMD